MTAYKDKKAIYRYGDRSSRDLVRNDIVSSHFPNLARSTLYLYLQAVTSHS